MRSFSLAALALSVATSAGASTVDLDAAATASRYSTYAAPDLLQVYVGSQGYIGFDLSGISHKIENAVLTLPWLSGGVKNGRLSTLGVFATSDPTNAIWTPTNDRSELPGNVAGSNWWDIKDLAYLGETSELQGSYQPGDSLTLSSDALDDFLNARKDAVGFATLILSERGRSFCQNPCSSISFKTPTLRFDGPPTITPSPSAVPLPASVVLLGFAMGGLGVAARRRS